MKTLNYRTSNTIENTRLQMKQGCNGIEQVIFFYISETYNFYTDGSKELFNKSYVKQDGRQYVRQSEVNRYYNNEKSYREAIKRWKTKAIA